MTIDKAIEINTQNLPHRTTNKLVDLYDAQSLGIEALKRYKECKSLPAYAILELLPGETKD